MGITGRYTMVLLSTLAALVIIVHSADEDYEGNYRRELRPRMLDTGTRRYEQPWRTMKAEPMLQVRVSTPDPIFEESSTEEPLRRRRPGRKRKRRPEPYSTEDVTSHERISIDEPLRPNIEIEDIKPADPPKRRRKKQDKSKWADNENRPLRRRGQRRKRPAADTWPVFSEFNDYRPNKKPQEEYIEISTDETDTLNIDGYYRPQNGPENSETLVKIPEKTQVTYRSEDNYEKHPDDYRPDDSVSDPSPAKEVEHTDINPILKDDKSFSEFSVEEYPVHDTRSEHEMDMLKQKMREKSAAYFREFLKAQDKGPIDPLTLKEILKKSNGSSLSEILQQHNLSLTDLLHGKEVALTILKSEEPAVGDQSMSKVLDVTEVGKQIEQETMEEEKESSEEKLLQNFETKYVPDPIIETTHLISIIEEETTTPELIETTSAIEETTTTEKAKIDDSTKRLNIRRYPVGSRRKQRIRPVINTNTYKSPLNRDLIAINARKYFNHRRRNITRTPEWKDVIPVAKKNISNKDTAETVETTTTNIIFEETTLQYKPQDSENVTITEIINENNVDSKNTPKETASNDLIINESNNPETKTSIVNNEKLTPNRQTVNATGLRRQAYNNVLKKKRRKLKYSTTEPPQDDIMKNLFGIPNLVSSSEFIARTQGPKTSLDDVTILEDFITTETAAVKHETKPKHTRYSTSMPYKPIVTSTTEETAKIEIEEILNDLGVSAKLSRILKERNMTLSELVEHRERGSSHVHLADIFQNTSREVSNPPEPFLSKSLIEPISKETYPLRALLEGKIHDTTTKATSTEVDTTGGSYVNVPVKMDFGNNVNENAENMGIMSLFHNITTNVAHEEESAITKDSEGRPYTSSVVVVNTTDASDTNDTVREGRLMHDSKDNQDDVVSWNEIFSLMRRNYENRTKYIKDGIIPAESIKKPTLEEDLDGDGLIVLEDLQHLHDIDNNIAASKETLNAHTNKRTEVSVKPSILDKVPSQTRSVTLATASIVGLVMVLFLLTFVGYKWRQHNRSSSKKNFDERIPSPVFENRKGHKNNSSSRSISPMLTSNIYTLSTVDSQNGKESPEYMWDSLRKPFQ